MAKILVVDDEPAICWGLSKLGEQLGHEVASASSVEAALDVIEHEAFALIFLDVRLPGMDGLTAIGPIREKLPEARIVIITAYGDLKTAVTAVREGAFEYLVKPFDLVKAEHVMNRALNAVVETRAGRWFLRKRRGTPRGEFAIDAGRVSPHRPRCITRFRSVVARREWHGKRTGCSCDSPVQSAQPTSFRRGQCCVAE